MGNLLIFSPIVALGFGKGGQKFCWGAPPPCPRLVAALMTVLPKHFRAISTISAISMLFFRCVGAKWGDVVLFLAGFNSFHNLLTIL